ncbi:MAG: hypothetical protein U5O39_20610 [Gammaproteobacteria bacterium]|nr:hypothetical protein [Gammaproteobacteria bacterium]
MVLIGATHGFQDDMHVRRVPGQNVDVAAETRRRRFGDEFAALSLDDFEEFKRVGRGPRIGMLEELCLARDEILALEVHDRIDGVDDVDPPGQIE